MLTIRYNDGGTAKSLELMADSLADLRPVMPRFTAWMQRQVQQEFQTAGDGTWAPRQEVAQNRFDASKQARIDKIQAGRYGTLSRSLSREKKKAERRLARTPQSKSKLVAGRQRSIARYEAQIAEVKRLGGGEYQPVQRNFKKLGERLQRRDVRAQEKIAAVERGDLLGAISASIVAEWSAQDWEMASRIPWAGVHNDGGTAGNGARMLKRTFLEWTPERIEMFGKMANDYIIERASKAMQKNAAA